MYDTGKIIAGLVIFAAIVTFPIWGGIGGAKAPTIVKPSSGQCVESAAYMRANHMQMLDEWRDLVVRDGKRVYTNSAGVKFDMSLSSTGPSVAHPGEEKKSCMSCHANKKEFCDACHDYSSVDPFCWTCHIEPKENI